MPIGLTIAGFDPSSGAGVTADLAVMAAQEIFGTACVTALTVQSTIGVRSSHAVEPQVIASTLNELEVDLPSAGIKIGMLACQATVEVVSTFLESRVTRVPVVLDPVLRSSSGRELLDKVGVQVLTKRMLGLVEWCTPNLDELAILSGLPVGTRCEMETAARALVERFPGLNVVATGGHLDTPEDLVAMADGGLEWVRGSRIESRATHGTGCAFSTALLCGLMRGLSGVTAVRQAKEYVEQAIRLAEPLGAGRGPMNLFWPLRTGSR